MKAGIDFIGVATPFFCHDGSGNFVLYKRSLRCRDEHHRWDFGSGEVGFSEQLEQSVLREVAEEYACQGTIDEQLPPYTLLRRASGILSHWVNIPFIIKVNRDQVRINEPDHMDELGWFSLHQLPTPLHTGAESAVARYAQYLHKYSSRP